MAKLPCRSTSPRYVPDLEEGGEKEANERNPFRWMIEGFSILQNRDAVTHCSGTFTACGIKWKLQLEPNSSGEDSEKAVSLYLFLVDASSSTSSAVKACYNLLIYDQLNGKHIEEKGEDYFHSTSRCGFCCMIPLKKFNNPKSGLLVNDCCIFGVEVLEAFVCKLERKGVSECLSLHKEITPHTYTWVLKDFSKLNERQVSETFAAGGYNWHIELYPNVAFEKNFLSIFLHMVKPTTLPSKTRVYVEFSFSLLDQINCKHEKNTGRNQFSSESSWGWRKFVAWNHLQDPSKGFLRNDRCIVEASVAILGLAGTT